MIVKHPQRVRQRFTSSHTLLINLKRPGEDFQGGATRFFMDGKSRVPQYSTACTMYCYVFLCWIESGIVLTFSFAEYIHSSLPFIHSDNKYIPLGPFYPRRTKFIFLQKRITGIPDTLLIVWLAL